MIVVLNVDQSIDFYFIIVVRSNVSPCFCTAGDCTTLQFLFSISIFYLPETSDEIPPSLWYAWLQMWQIKKSVETRNKKIILKVKINKKKEKAH